MERTSTAGRFPTNRSSYGTSQASFAYQGEAATSYGGYARDGEQDAPDHVLQPPAWLRQRGKPVPVLTALSNGHAHHAAEMQTFSANLAVLSRGIISPANQQRTSKHS